MMRRVIAVLVGLVGLWFLVAGVASIVGTGTQSFASPPMTSAVILGVALLSAAALLWRRCVRRDANA
jgi:hypothetical protein